MSMKPAHRKGRHGGREALWEAIRTFRRFTITQIVNETTGLDPSSVRAYIKSLAAAGYVREVEKGRPFHSAIYEIIKHAVDPPRVRLDGTQVTQGRGREQMWRSMDILKTFGLDDLVAASSTEEHRVSRNEAKHYCLYLVKAGYLRKDGKTYIHTRYTGPKSPQIQRIRQVWDPNLKEVVWPTKP